MGYAEEKLDRRNNPPVLKELNYLLDKKMKLRTLFVFIVISLGSMMDMLGVAVVLPIIELAMSEKDVHENKWASMIMDLTGVDNKTDVLIILIISTIALYIFKSFYLVWMNAQSYKFSMDLRRTMSVRLMRDYFKQPYAFFLKKNTSEILRSVRSDTGELYSVVINCLMVLSNGITVIGLGAIMFLTNFWMTVMLMVIMGICAAIIFLVINRRFRHYGDENHRLSAVLIQELKQSFEGVKEIRILGTEKYFVRSYEDNFKEQAKYLTKFSVYNTIPKNLVEAAAVSGILLFLGASIMFNENNTDLIAQLSTFCVAAFKILPGVNAISQYVNTIIFGKAAVDLVYNDIKEIEELEKKNAKLREEAGKNGSEVVFEDSIKAEGVSFRYEEATTDVFSGVNLEIKKGHSTAFIGPSGGGKTTMVDILLGLLDPTEGKVTVDGRNIKDTKSYWYKHLGYIPQNIYLTDDTIRKNVEFGIDEKEIDDKKVWQALEEAQLDDFVKGLPDGLDTKVGERGSRISGGQRQRIGIARALYRNPEVLVFDEATSALDTETEKEVMKAVDSLHGSKTIIMIAHRLSTIENCDEVYRIEGGKVEKTKDF